MTTQLLVVIFCVFAAVVFMARKVFLTVKGKAGCNCGDCPTSGCESCKENGAFGIREIRGK